MLKAFYELISQTADSSEILLLEERKGALRNLFSGISSVKKIPRNAKKLFEISEEEVMWDAANENARTLFDTVPQAKRIFLKKFRGKNGNLLLILFLKSEKNFGKKRKAQLNAILKTLDDFLEMRKSQNALVPKHFFVPLFVYDKRLGKTLFTTDGLTALLGFTAEDWQKKRKTILKRMDVASYPALRRFLTDLGKNKEAYVDFIMSDLYGNERYLRCYAASFDENPDRVIGILLDNTNEKHLQARLESANSKFKTLLNISNDLIFSLNRSGYFMLVNDEGAINLGYVGHELIGKHFLEIVSENDKPSVALAFQKILKSNDAVTFDVRFIDKYGGEIPFQITATSLKSGEEITGMIGYGKNFTRIFNEKKKLKELNEKLLEANRLLALERDRATEQVSALEKLNELKNEFISNVSHELRTPLASIIGFAEAIAEDASLSRDLVREFNGIILEEGKRLTRLIDDILDYSKFEENAVELNYEEFNLIESLKILIDNYRVQAEVKKIDLISELPEAEFTVEADRRQIEKAFGHIISNALKFTPEKGKVTVSALNFLNEVSVSVTDTGIGIPKEELKNLFEKFKKAERAGKTHVPGAGLGLALTKKIIDSHGGSISVTSRENQGTTITVTLPKKRSV